MKKIILYQGNTLVKDLKKIIIVLLIQLSYIIKINNIEAKQYFTDLGPLAFLPLSKKLPQWFFQLIIIKLDRVYFKKFVSNFNTNLKLEKIF